MTNDDDRETTNSIWVSSGKWQLMTVSPRPEQSRHASPHGWHACPLQVHVLSEVTFESGMCPEPEPDAEGVLSSTRSARCYVRWDARVAARKRAASSMAAAKEAIGWLRMSKRGARFGASDESFRSNSTTWLLRYFIWWEVRAYDVIGCLYVCFHRMSLSEILARLDARMVFLLVRWSFWKLW